MLQSRSRGTNGRAVRLDVVDESLLAERFSRWATPMSVLYAFDVISVKFLLRQSYRLVSYQDDLPVLEVPAIVFEHCVSTPAKGILPFRPGMRLDGIGKRHRPRAIP